jgi:hypothetical protein
VMASQEAKNQAIGWLVSTLGRSHLLREIERAKDHPEIAAQFSEWLRLTSERPRFEPVASVGLPLYRCLGVCGHVGTSEAEMAAHHAEAHEGER